MPEILVSEWNANDATRASPYHPTTMAEGYFALLESGVSRAAIASLDAYTNSATMSSNDYGLLLPDSAGGAFQRPAYFVSAALDGLTQASTAAPRYAAYDGLRVVALPSSEPNCHDLVLWDFAPDPLTSGLHSLLVNLPTTAMELALSYADASSSSPTPEVCNAYIAAATNRMAARALCTDLLRGHLYPRSLAHSRRRAGVRQRLGSRVRVRKRAPALARAQAGGCGGGVDRRLLGRRRAGQASATVVREDHAQPAPKTSALGLGADGSSLTFTLARNAVAQLTNVCIRPSEATP